MLRRTLLAAAGTAPLLSYAAAPATKKIGVALGAGSARGFAHIGVLKALVEAGLAPEVVAGTSAGSLVGAFYAAGYTPWQIEDVALKLRDIEIVDLGQSNKRGMFTGETLQKLVNQYVKDVPMERFKRRFGAVATVLKSGELRLLSSGNAGAAIRASCSIPGVFVPCVIGDEELVDGGLVSPLPVKAARKLGADVVIGVDVGVLPQNTTRVGLYEVILQSFEIMGRSLSQLEGQTADFMIRPDTARFSSTDFTVRKEIVQAGYEAGVAALPELRQLLRARGFGLGRAG
ncbi:patatin-like phospholipase family protein [Rhodoferax sp.]|uniref:patatin-like phospholipase family protein n=1 Tax=Rhodoferax sp. TaxID=50421 RepID=UPI0025FED2FC|nr:patatin-like phospholipase family protein [Rhodoferax sp.]